jgi:hypothetical protein
MSLFFDDRLREHETADNRDKALRVELRERADLPLVALDDDPTGTVPGKGAGVLCRSAKR